MDLIEIAKDIDDWERNGDKYIAKWEKRAIRLGMNKLFDDLKEFLPLTKDLNNHNAKYHIHEMSFIIDAIDWLVSNNENPSQPEIKPGYPGRDQDFKSGYQERNLKKQWDRYHNEGDIRYNEILTFIKQLIKKYDLISKYQYYTHYGTEHKIDAKKEEIWQNSGHDYLFREYDKLRRDYMHLHNLTHDDLYEYNTGKFKY